MTSDALRFPFVAALFATFLMISMVGCGDSSEPTHDPGTDSTADQDPIGSDEVLDETADEPDQSGEEDVVTEDTVEVDDSDADPEDAEIEEDETPPYVVSSIPANEAIGVKIPFEVHVTFSEALRADTVDDNGFRVYDYIGKNTLQPMQGTVSYDPETFTVSFIPSTGAIFRKATPYLIEIGGRIQDRAGNMVERTTIRFATEAFPDLEPYFELAKEYAPVLKQAVDKMNPALDYPTKVNFDGDWDITNNLANLQTATSITPAVYWDVIESKTHYFIRYAFYYLKKDGQSQYANDLSGAMVVVEKTTKTPIAVETYFSDKDFEDFRSYVTQESGLVVDGGKSGTPNGDYNDDDRIKYGANWVFLKNELFPNNRYVAYLSAKGHESCVWAQENKENAQDDWCDLSGGKKATLSIVEMAYTGAATDIEKAPNWPFSTGVGQAYGYELLSMMDEWWVRRDRSEDLFSGVFTYEAPDNRPGSEQSGALKAPAGFQGAGQDGTAGALMPWVWQWIKPRKWFGDTFPAENGIKPGYFFMDPAYYFALKHQFRLSNDNTDFSGAYCYNPYLMPFLDPRKTDPQCR
ncbi:MAG TPA: Ig-like domain-containing protein [Myxococcota bacterium]|nr:Ig-like domain-containing protein [Myxococcota bacterium]